MAMAQNDKMLPIGTKLHGGVYEIIKQETKRRGKHHQHT